MASRIALDKGNPTRDQIRTHEQESVRIHYPRLNQRFNLYVSLGNKHTLEYRYLEVNKHYAAIDFKRSYRKTGICREEYKGDTVFWGKINRK